MPTIDGDVERGAHFAHPVIAETSQSLHEGAYRHALDRIQIDRRALGYRVFVRLQDDLAGQTADGRRARRYQSAPQPWDGGIAGENDNRTATDLWKLTPPNLSPRGERARLHDAEAASRNDAKSPHASGSDKGCPS